MPFVEIIKPGALTTIQDKGRFGFQAYGVPVSGAMDKQSFFQANRLLGNAHHEAVLEMTLNGADIKFEGDSAIALAGADMSPALNGKSIPMNQAIKVKSGDYLSFAELRRGCRAYLAFRGGIDIERVMGSRSTYLYGGFGGFNGRALQTGDRLKTGGNMSLADPGVIESKDLSLKCKDKGSGNIFYGMGDVVEVRVVAGPEVERFSEVGLSRFLNETFSLSYLCDRMGYRLDGPVIECNGSADIISSPVIMGTIQVTGEGRPVILMADCQTTGGYVRIATVISSDLPKLGQLKPGDRLKFREVRVQELWKR